MKKFGKILGVVLIALCALIFTFFGHRDLPLEELKLKYAQSPSSFLNLDGMEVHYRDEGKKVDSIPIILIHGTGASLHTFDEWTKVMQEHRRVIRLDLPAYGLTGPFPDRNYSIDHYVKFLKNFLDGLDVRHCVLGGNSLGGQIAWEFTARHPDRVEKLILIDAAGYPKHSESVPLAFRLARIPLVNKILTFVTPRSMVKTSLKNVYSDKTKVSDHLVDRYFELSLRQGNRQAFVDRMNVKYDTTSIHLIKSIHQPTLVMWGENDQLITPASAWRFHNDLPNDTLLILKGVGHVPMEENPLESSKVVLGFLKEK